MKKITITILVLWFGFYGCAFTFQSLNDEALEIKGIKSGMGKEEVIEAIGRPQVIKSIVIENEGYEVWKYPIERLWTGKYKPLGLDYYQILFYDCKVSRWDKVRAYAHPDYEFQEPSAGNAGVTTIEIFQIKKDE